MLSPALVEQFCDGGVPAADGVVARGAAPAVARAGDAAASEEGVSTSTSSSGDAKRSFCTRVT